MRRRAISRCWLRMRALSWGSPSISFISLRTSSLVMRSLLWYCHSWKGTSRVTMRAIEATMTRVLKRMVCPIACRPASTGWPIRANTWSFSCRTTHATTPPTSSALRMPFTSSPTLCMENMRPKPLSGSRRVQSGASALLEKFSPPIVKGPARAATTRISSSGPRVASASPASCRNRAGRAVASKASSRPKVSPRDTAPLMRCASQEPPTHSAPEPAIRTRKADSSRDCGTWPSSRACSSRRGDAGSVFSRSESSAMAPFHLSRPHPKAPLHAGRGVGGEGYSMAAIIAAPGKGRRRE